MRSSVLSCLLQCLQVPLEMENEGTNGMAKRVKTSVEEKETLVEDGSIVQVQGDETEPRAPNSEQMEIEIAHILEKINNFTQMVSELLESGKSVMKELSNEFEERMILIHKEQMEKWQEEIKKLRSLDAANEETDALLHNAKYLFQNIHGGS
ncbi:hypothetical protein BUALT_Bualt17G0102700 [Buddleja alternifolia]|uniref:Knotted 1-binding protein 36 n=1 Tax=Buddleja alternifolia TaxID=168488 RepID=A0AAV6WI43_9LAMI|nr:hypothetical protein BUALT_Bualt17G0102700 [Buddleja alternifolia]